MSVNSSGITYVLESGGVDISAAMQKKLIEIAAWMGKRVPELTEDDFILYMISTNEVSAL